jgi:XTP/dITP diphosphohydrolase
MKLVLATRNRYKVEEMMAILGDLKGWQLLSLDEFPQAPEVEESGETLEENASLKVQQAVAATGLISLAEDTGLVIDALGGRPGVCSARFAGEQARYEENVAKVLELMAEVPPGSRTARFRSVVAIMGTAGGSGDWPKGRPQFFEGICPGMITAERRGSGGFGYDPIFVPDGYHQTFAQMDGEQKNRISHRAKALAGARECLIELRKGCA